MPGIVCGSGDLCSPVAVCGAGRQEVGCCKTGQELTGLASAVALVTIRWQSRALLCASGGLVTVPRCDYLLVLMLLLLPQCCLGWWWRALRP